MITHVAARRFQELYWRAVSLQLFFQKRITDTDIKEELMFRAALEWVNLKSEHGNSFQCKMYELAVETGYLQTFINMTEFVPCWLAEQLLEIEIELLKRLHDKQFKIPVGLRGPIVSSGEPYKENVFYYSLKFPEWLTLALPQDFPTGADKSMRILLSFENRLRRVCDTEHEHTAHGRHDCLICETMDASKEHLGVRIEM